MDTAEHIDAQEVDEAASDVAQKVTRAWKGFGKDFCCNPNGDDKHQYAVGETYKLDGSPIICRQGFHACTTPIDVINYYPAATSRYAEVELIGETVTHTEGGSDSKIAASEIRIVREISYFELWAAHRAWVADQDLEASATGDSGHASATGDSGHASATGDSGHASATGDSGHASATGYRGHASATGDSGHASATGYRGHASATGYSGHASATGKDAISASLGIDGRAKASAGNWIVLAAYGDGGEDWRLLFVKSAKCGNNKGELKPDVWYRLDRNGEFVECEENE